MASIPLAAFITAVFSARYLAVKAGILALIVVFISLNLYQTYQFALNYIPWERATPKYYWYIFGKNRFDNSKCDNCLVP